MGRLDVALNKRPGIREGEPLSRSRRVRIRFDALHSQGKGQHPESVGVMGVCRAAGGGLAGELPRTQDARQVVFCRRGLFHFVCVV